MKKFDPSKTAKLAASTLIGTAIGFGGSFGLCVFAINSQFSGVVQIKITFTSVDVRIIGPEALKYLPGANDLVKPRPNSDDVILKEDPFDQEVVDSSC
jgi:hypothetical protein